MELEILKHNLGIKRILDTRNEIVDIYNTASFHGDLTHEEANLLYPAIKALDKFIDKMEKKYNEDNNTNR